MNALPSYAALADELRFSYKVANLAAVEGALLGRPPDYDVNTAQGVFDLCDGIVGALNERFPTWLEPAGIYDIPHLTRDEYVCTVWDFELWDVACFLGLCVDNVHFPHLRWPMQLTLALSNCTQDNSWSDFGGQGPFYGQACAWWEDHAAKFALPPLDQVAYPEVKARLNAAWDYWPEPWNGVGAAWYWLNGETGYLFADIPGEYAHEVDLSDLDWTMDAIERLTQDYQDADRRVFTPVSRLDDLCDKEDEAKATCFDLALGRILWENRDGELIVLGRREE